MSVWRLIDWGTDTWWHSEPWRLMTTKSVTYNGPGITSASFTFLTPSRLISLLAFNGGTSTTVTLSCAGETDKQVTLSTGELVTIATGWAGTCTGVTIASTNGWDTNFDDLLIDTP